MEYLMTYGWAIVAIGVVIAVFYSLGIFGLGSNSSTGCAVIEGFSCSKPVLYSSGILTADIGQVGVTKIITATGCSQNATAPSTWNFTSITLASGQTSGASFQCPWVAGLPAGAPVTATLWVQYATSTQSGAPTIVQQVAEIRTTVQATGIPGLSSGMFYAPVTLTNDQGSATGSNFQQELVVPSSFSQYESADLGNIRFYQGGTELYSWCESSCTKGSAALFWVNLQNGMAANSGTVIYMVLENTVTVDYDGVYAGECPSCSGPYAEYDNGASVFGNYQNFFGSACPSGWTCSNPGNNPGMVSNGLNLGPGGGIWAAPNLFVFSSPGIVEFYGSLSWDTSTQIGIGPGLVVLSNDQYGNAIVTGAAYLSASAGMTITPSFDMGTFTAFSPLPNKGQAYVWSYMDTGTTAISQYNYQSGSQASYAYPYVGSYATVTLQDSAIWPASLSASWIRTRAYPPNGVMPATSFGSVGSS